MSTTTETIEIYHDEQAGTDPGWAYRATVQRDGETETGPSGSGPIDGEAADALTDLCDHGVLSDGQRDAIADLVDSEGWDRARVVLADVGQLWPSADYAVA